MTGIDYFKRAFSKWSDFEGRASVEEYWYFVLFNILTGIGLALLSILGKAFFLIYILYALIAIVPGIAVSIRRLHDTNRAGVNILFGLIPLAGFIILLIFYIERGTEGANRFGPSPMQAIDEDHFL